MHLKPKAHQEAQLQEACLEGSKKDCLKRIKFIMGFLCYSHGLNKTSKYESTHYWSIRIAFILGHMLGHVE